MYQRKLAHGAGTALGVHIAPRFTGPHPATPWKKNRAGTASRFALAFESFAAMAAEFSHRDKPVSCQLESADVLLCSSQTAFAARFASQEKSFYFDHLLCNLSILVLAAL